MKDAEAEMKGIWLALDTSTAAMTIALMEDGDIVGERDSLSERNHSIRLLPAVEELLASAGLKAKDLQGVAVGHGPGSYTGIRIGVTVAKMLAWSLSLPLIGVSSLEALAYGVVLREETAPVAGSDSGGKRDASGLWVVPLMDARRGKVYTGLYEWSNGAWTCVVPDGIRLMADWLQELAAREPGGQFYFTGDYDGFVPLLEAFGSASKADVHWDNEPLKAKAVGMLARKYGELRRVADIHGFEPNYTQLSEPEKKWLANNR